ncbi:MAG: hypothetical protein ACRDUT_06375 [Mycobacterium sp.]
MSSVVNALFTHRHAEAGARTRRHQKSPWVVGATAALLLIGIIGPAGTHETTTASEQSTAGTSVTTMTTTPPAGGATVGGGSGDVVVGTHGGSAGHVIPAGCVGGLNC